MKLDKKKALASRTLGVGKDRIIFLKSRIDEIKEAITKQDIRDLCKDGAIIIRNIKGSRKTARRKYKKGAGKISRKIKTKKRDYVKMTRKLRESLCEANKNNLISKKDLKEIRKKIKNKAFKSKRALKEYIQGLK